MWIVLNHKKIEFDYVNWKGVPSHRRAEVFNCIYGSNEYHPEPQFLLRAYDLDKKEMRTFAMKDITNVKML